MEGETLLNRQYAQRSRDKVRRRNKAPEIRDVKIFVVALKNFKGAPKFFRRRYKILKRGLGGSWDALKFRGRASFSIFSTKNISRNFGCADVRPPKISSEKKFFFSRKLGVRGFSG